MNKVEITVPRNFEEVTPKQLRFLASLQMAGETEENIWSKCFIRFAGIKPITTINDVCYLVKKDFKGYFTMSVDDMAYFARQMKWLTKSYVGITPLKISRFNPCDRLLRNTVFIQYLDAENYYQAFLHKKDPVYLDKLIATLFQTGMEYDNAKTAARAKRISRSRRNVEKYIVIIWMIGIKEFFSRKFKHLFARASGEESDEPINMIEIMNNQVRALTDGDITKRKQVLSSSTWDALIELNEKCREAAELKSKTK